MNILWPCIWKLLFLRIDWRHCYKNSFLLSQMFISSVLWFSLYVIEFLFRFQKWADHETVQQSWKSQKASLWKFVGFEPVLMWSFELLGFFRGIFCQKKWIEHSSTWQKSPKLNIGKTLSPFGFSTRLCLPAVQFLTSRWCMSCFEAEEYDKIFLAFWCSTCLLLIYYFTQRFRWFGKFMAIGEPLYLVRFLRVLISLVPQLYLTVCLRLPGIGTETLCDLSRASLQEVPKCTLCSLPPFGSMHS